MSASAAHTPQQGIALHYFNIRGKAEFIRLMLEDHGVSYEDIRIERADWWTGGVKAEYAKRGLSVFGQLPVVVVDGVRMVQSVAITRYLAKRVGAYGDNDLIQYRCDMVADGCEDWRGIYSDVMYASNFDEIIGAYIRDKIPQQVRIFETIFQETAPDAQYSADPTRPLFGDYLLWEMLDVSLRLDATCLDAAPLLKGFYERMKQRPRLAAYLASGRRPEHVNNSKRG